MVGLAGGFGAIPLLLLSVLALITGLVFLAGQITCLLNDDESRRNLLIGGLLLEALCFGGGMVSSTSLLALGAVTLLHSFSEARDHLVDRSRRRLRSGLPASFRLLRAGSHVGGDHSVGRCHLLFGSRRQSGERTQGRLTRFDKTERFVSPVFGELAPELLKKPFRLTGIEAFRSGGHFIHLPQKRCTRKRFLLGKPLPRGEEISVFFGDLRLHETA